MRLVQRRQPALRVRGGRHHLSQALTATDPSPSEADAASRGSAVKLAAEGVGRALTLVTTVLLARLLGVEDFGAFEGMAAAAVLLAELADLGLQSTASRALVAGTLGLRPLLKTKLLLTAVVVAGAAVSGRGGLLATLVLYFTLAGWSEILGVALRARGRPMQEALVILVFRAAGLALVWPVLRLGLGLEAVAWAQAAATVPPILLAGILLARAPAIGGITASPPGETVASVLRGALPLGVNAGLALLSLRVERLALWRMASAEEMGLFAAGLRLVEPLLLIPAAIVAGAMPALTREALRGEGPVRRRTAYTIALVAVPACVGLALLARDLLLLLFGPSYGEAASVLRVLALSLPAVFLNGMMFHALIAAGRVAWVPGLTALRLAAAVAFALWLVPAMGAWGAAAGFTGAEWTLFLLLTRAGRRSAFPVPVAAPLAAAGLLTLPMAALVASVPLPVLGAVPMGAGAYAAALGAAWWWMKRRRAPAAGLSAGAGTR